jgi:hypothetical protein
MAASETAIANSALAKIGSARVISLNDDSTEARLLKEQYPKVRDDLLRSHPWNFAIVRTTLAALTTAPSWGFSRQFQVPADCLRVLDIDAQDLQWEREGNIIVSDATSIGIRYVKKVTEVGNFDACFSEALATKLAADICFALTQSTTLKELLMKEFEKKVREARSFDGQEGGPKRVYAREWLNSRY